MDLTCVFSHLCAATKEGRMSYLLVSLFPVGVFRQLHSVRLNKKWRKKEWDCIKFKVHVNL
jgi:hypothetical protein